MGAILGREVRAGTGRALNRVLAFSSSSSRFSLSSLCALFLADMASPGKEKLALVTGLEDLAGTKPGLLVDSNVALVTGFFVTLSLASTSESAKDIPDLTDSPCFEPEDIALTVTSLRLERAVAVLKVDGRPAAGLAWTGREVAVVALVANTRGELVVVFTTFATGAVLRAEIVAMVFHGYSLAF